MITLTPHQNKALEAIRHHDFQANGSFYLGGAAGSGKQLHENSEIQTPKGPKLIKNISVGDEIFTVDGTTTFVTGFFPQGIKPAYKLTFRDKSEVIAGPEHQWVYYTSKGNLNTITTEEMLRRGVVRDWGAYKFRIPLCKPVKYPNQFFFIEPYLLGVLIGDGSLTKNTMALSWGLGDEFIVEKCKPLLASIGCHFSEGRFTSKNGKQVTICSNYKERNSNSLKKEIIDLELNVHSGEKFIPKHYLWGGYEQRLELLKGLMDTDGTCCKNRTSFSTTSYQLAKDIKTLVCSLGGTAIIHTYDRIHHNKSTEYHINIKMFVNPFSLPRKAEKWSFSKKNPPSRYLVSIERVEDANQYCISVAHESKLYLTNDFIVTHNSSLLGYLSSMYGDKISFLSPTGKAAQVLKSKLPPYTKVATVHHALYQPKDVCKEEIKELKIKAKGDELARKRLNFLNELMESIGVEFLECIKSEYLDGIVVVDEASMLGYREFSILEKSGSKTIYVGDPFQLQPVKSKQILPSRPTEFNAFLSEVHRTALGSPITRLATEIRMQQFRGWNAWKNEGIRVEKKLHLDEYRAADQVLTGMNSTRHKLNRNIRLEKDKHTPVEDDKIIIKQNIYDFDFVKGRKVKYLRLVNGDISYIDKVIGSVCCFKTSTGRHNILLNDHNFAETYGKQPIFAEKQGVKADYAYGITVHASQGSEWDNVIIYDDEMRKSDKMGRLHWFYTAVTRAKEKLTIVKP